MSLTSAEIANIAKLARLNPSQEVLDSFAEQTSSILEYFNQLSNVDTSKVEALYNPLVLMPEFQQNLREDEVFKLNTKAEILANSPAPDSNYFIVPKIVEGK